MMPPALCSISISMLAFAGVDEELAHTRRHRDQARNSTHRPTGPQLGFGSLEAADDRAGDALGRLHEQPRRVGAMLLVASALRARLRELGLGADGMDAGHLDTVLAQFHPHRPADVVLGGLAGRVDA